MSILGREAIIKLTAPDATELELNRIKDDTGDPVRPYVKIRRVGGLHGLGDAEANADPRVGGDGEIPRTSKRRGKTITLEGLVRASSAAELREYQSTIRQALAERSDEYRVDHLAHPLATSLAGMDRYYNARVIGLEMEDVRDSQRFESTFVLGLRNYAGVYYEDFTLASFKQAIIDLGPSLYWALDSVDTDDDLSGEGNDAFATMTVGSAAGLLPGIASDSATDFDGTDDVIVVAATPDPVLFPNGGTVTVIGWASRDATASEDVLVSGEDGEPALSLASGSQVVNIVAGGGPTAIGTWPGTAQPVFFALTLDDATGAAALYLDGEPAGSVDLGASAEFDNNAGLVLGLRGASGPFDGKMAHFALFSRALTPTDIQSIYAWGSTGIRTYI